MIGPLKITPIEGYFVKCMQPMLFWHAVGNKKLYSWHGSGLRNEASVSECVYIKKETIALSAELNLKVQTAITWHKIFHLIFLATAIAQGQRFSINKLDLLMVTQDFTLAKLTILA